MKAMPLKPQDLYICLKLVTLDEQPSYGRLAGEVMMSPSQVHTAVGRATAAGLLDASRRPAGRRCWSSSSMGRATPSTPSGGR